MIQAMNFWALIHFAGMRNWSLSIPALVLALSLSGCTWDFYNKDFVVPQHKLQPPNFYLVSLGMSKDEVVSKLGPPDQLVGARSEGGVTVETWEYHRVAAVPGPDQIAERYQVVFTNGKLSGYESSGFRSQLNSR
jgi:hypothetical protein